VEFQKGVVEVGMSVSSDGAFLGAPVGYDLRCWQVTLTLSVERGLSVFEDHLGGDRLLVVSGSSQGLRRVVFRYRQVTLTLLVVRVLPVSRIVLGVVSGSSLGRRRVVSRSDICVLLLPATERESQSTWLSNLANVGWVSMSGG
jgi:hypothetical protein